MDSFDTADAAFEHAVASESAWRSDLEEFRSLRNARMDKFDNVKPVVPKTKLYNLRQQIYKRAPMLTPAQARAEWPKVSAAAETEANDRSAMARFNGLSPHDWVLEFFVYCEDDDDVPFMLPSERRMEMLRGIIRQRGAELRATLAQLRTTATRAMNGSRNRFNPNAPAAVDEWTQARMARLENQIHKLDGIARLSVERIRERKDLSTYTFDELSTVLARCKGVAQTSQAGRTRFELVECADRLKTLRCLISERIAVYGDAREAIVHPQSPVTPLEQALLAEFTAAMQMQTEKEDKRLGKKLESQLAASDLIGVAGVRRASKEDNDSEVSSPEAADEDDDAVTGSSASAGLRRQTAKTGMPMTGQRRRRDSNSSSSGKDSDAEPSASDEEPQVNAGDASSSSSGSSSDSGGDNSGSGSSSDEEEGDGPVSRPQPQGGSASHKRMKPAQALLVTGAPPKPYKIAKGRQILSSDAVKARKYVFSFATRRYGLLLAEVLEAQLLVLSHMQTQQDLNDAYSETDAGFTLAAHNGRVPQNVAEGRGSLRLQLNIANDKRALDPLGGHQQYLMRLQHYSEKAEMFRTKLSGNKKRAPGDKKQRGDVTTMTRYVTIEDMRIKVERRERRGFKQRRKANGDEYWEYLPDAGPTARTWRDDAEPTLDDTAGDISSDNETPFRLDPAKGSSEFKKLTKEEKGFVEYRLRRHLHHHYMQRAREDVAEFRSVQNVGSIPKNAVLLWDERRAELQFWLTERNEVFGTVTRVRVCDDDDAKTVSAVLYDAQAPPPTLQPVWAVLQAMMRSAHTVWNAAWTLDYMSGRHHSGPCLQIHNPDDRTILEISFVPQAGMIYAYSDIEQVKAWCMRQSTASLLAWTVLKHGRFWVPIQQPGGGQHANLENVTLGSTAAGRLMEAQWRQMRKHVNTLINITAKIQGAKAKSSDKGAARAANILRSDPRMLGAYLQDVLGIHLGPVHMSMQTA